MTCILLKASTSARGVRDLRAGVAGVLLLGIEHNYFQHRVNSGLNLPCLALVLNTLDDLKHVLPFSGSQASHL